MKRKLSRLIIAGMSLVSLSFWSENQGNRTIACVDGLSPMSVSAGTIPLETDLFAHIQDPELKKSTEYYYAFLKQTQFDYYVGLQNTRSQYGLSGDIWGNIPSISYTAFDPMNQGRIINENTLWGNFLSVPFSGSGTVNSPIIIQKEAPQASSSNSPILPPNVPNQRFDMQVNVPNPTFQM